MMRSLVVSLAFSVCVTGCTRARTLLLVSPAVPDAPDAINNEIADRVVTLSLDHGAPFDADSVNITSGDVTWRSRRASGTHSVTQSAPASDLRTLSFNSHTRGALDGLLIGLVVGAPLGAAIIDSPSGKSGRRVEAALSGSLSIGAWSALIGAIKGSRIVYEVAVPPQPSDGDRPLHTSAAPIAVK